MGAKLKGRALVLSRIFSHPVYAAAAVISTAAFYYLFRYLIEANNHGIFLVLVPLYLVYVMAATSGLVFSTSLFAIAHSVASRRAGELGSIEGILVPSISGIVAGCGCAFPLLESVLLFFGVNALEAAGIVSLISSYQSWIMLALVLLNVAMMYYYLGKIPLGPRRRGTPAELSRSPRQGL